MKKVLCIMMATLLMLTSLPVITLSASAAEVEEGIILGGNNVLTRAEWLHNLVVTFDMYVEEEAMPDNYFTDLDESHRYYEDIILAVEFGVVNIPAGEELKPDDPVTRDFAVSTLNFCLGYQLEEGREYTFVDYELCSDPDSAQIALDRGWVSLAGTLFRPDLEITDTEIKAMTDDAASVLEGQIVDPNYESTYEYAEDVIVIPDGTDVVEDENGNFIITDYEANLLVGDKFAVYLNGIPNVYKVSDISYDDDKIIITPETVEVEDAFESIDAQGVLDTETMEIIPVEGVDVSLEEDTSAVSTYAVKKVKNINAKMEIPFSGFKGSVTVKIKNPYVDYSVTSGRVYVALCGETTITYKISASLSDVMGVDTTLPLFSINIAGIGSFDVTVDVDLSGSISGTVKGDLVAGFECSKGGGLRAVKSFKQKEFYYNAEVEASVSLKASLGVTKMPVVKAYVYAQVGMKCNFSQTNYKDGSTPKQCTHIGAYMFAKYGASASAKFGVFSVSESIDYNIYTESNSPVRIVHHYEDKVEVPKCTRGNTYANFFTKGTSRWGGSGWMGANGAYGLNADGTPFKLYDYTLNDNNEATITKYNGNSWSVYIPKEIDGYTVVAIGSNAFKYKDVGYVDIPDTVTSIGSSAFYQCYSLRTVNIPDSVTSIGSSAFYNCINLSSIELPKTLTTIYYDAFYNCDSLKEINIPKALETVYTNTGLASAQYQKDGPFDNCSGLKNVIFEEGITNIPSRLFAYCDGLEDVTIPDTVTTIGAMAFYNCSSLNKITLSKNLTTIFKEVFYNCINLSSIELPKTLTTIYYDAFYNCDSLKEINIPKALETVYTNTGLASTQYQKDGPFDNCSGLKNVIFEEGITNIPSRLFAYCDGLEDVTIPDTVTTIEQMAFYSCTSLKKITLSKNLTTIYKEAFCDCASLKDVVLPDSLDAIGSGIFKNCTSIEKINITCKFGTALVGYNNDFEGPFYNCSNLKNVTFSEGIDGIFVQMFERCTGLEKIEIPDTVQTIFGSSFDGCESLTEINIPKSITRIYANAFRNCKSLKTIELPDVLSVFGTNCFDGCTSLEKVKLPNDLVEIPDYTFYNCSSLKTIVLPASINIVNQHAFYNCKSLESITIPDSVTEIGDYAFAYCSSLESVSLPKGILKIEDGTFYGCTALKEADIPFGTSTINNYAFKNCTALEKVNIPRTVKTINSQAFMGCETLKDVNIADYSITEIKSDTFKDCPSIEKIVLPNGLTKIGSQAFMNCTSLVEVTIPESITSIETNALSYPDKTTIRGKKGSYAETFANENGFKFVDYSIPAEGIILKGDDDDHIDIELGETFYAEFEFYPEDANDVVTLKADNSNVTIKGHDITGYRAGDSTITATTTSGMEYEFTVHVRKVSEIKIITNPTKTTYLMGESFDPTGMEVQAVYSDGFSRVVDGWTVTGFDSSKEGKNTITVKWVAPSGSSYTKTLTLTIVDPAPKLTGIFIETEPTKTAYELREKLDLTGMVVMGTYTDGSKKEVNGYTTSGYNALKKGTHTITVSYEGFTDTFTVTVGETPTEPPKPEVMMGDVDDDSKVTILDVTAVQRHIAQLTTIPENRLTCADTDNDGKVTILDATKIQRFIAQLIPEL